jgi:hypothetical protein
VNITAAKEVKIGIVANVQGFGVVKGTAELAEGAEVVGRAP